MKSRSRRLRRLAVLLTATTIVSLSAAVLASAGVNYLTTMQTGQSIVPGTTDVGNHCDDCATLVNFPFPVSVYGDSYTSGYVTDNGSLQERRRLYRLPRPADQRLRPLADRPPERSSHRRTRGRDLRDHDRQPAPSPVRGRVADDVLPAFGDGELRDHPPRGLGDALGHLRPDGGQRRSRNERNPVLRRRALHAVLLRRVDPRQRAARELRADRLSGRLDHGRDG